MTDLEQRIREAYDAQSLPGDVRARSLSYIESVRRAAAEAPDGGASEFPAGAANGPGAAGQGGNPASRSVSPRASESLAARPLGRRPRRRRWMAAAACLLLVLAAFGAYGIYQIPSAYVDIDVNPAIELTVNPFGAVIAANALNDDGRAVLDAVPVLHRPYKDAIDALATSEVLAAYAQEDGFVDINVVADSDQLGESLMAASDAALAAMPCEHACHRADAATREEASAAGLCIGRYRAARELMELDSSYTLDECASMSMRQLRDHIDACQHGQATGASEDGETPGSGQGHGQGNGHGHGHGRHGA